MRRWLLPRALAGLVGALVSTCMPADLFEREWKLELVGVSMACVGKGSTFRAYTGWYRGLFLLSCTDGGRLAVVAFKDKELVVNVDTGERFFCEDLNYSPGGVVLSCEARSDYLPAFLRLTATGGGGGSNPARSPQ